MSSSRYYFGKPVPVYLKVLSLAVPLVLMGALTMVLIVRRNGGAALELWWLTLLSYLYANKFIILRGAMPSAHFGPWAIAGLVIWLDLATVLFMIANLDVLHRMPYVGRKIRETRIAGWRLLHAHKWLRRMAVLGLALFVGFPVFGTGSIGGTLFARLVGLDRPGTVVGVLLGSVAGCSLLAVGTSFVRTHEGVFKHPVWSVAALLLLVTLVFALGRLAKRGAGKAPPPPEGETP